jgi:hypothetical protein
MDNDKIFPTPNALLSLIGDLPIVSLTPARQEVGSNADMNVVIQIYFALNAYYNPKAFSIASMAILQQSSERLRMSINRIIVTGRRFRQNVDKVKALYNPDIPSGVRTGDRPYPSHEKSSAGMSFELR